MFLTHLAFGRRWLVLRLLWESYGLFKDAENFFPRFGGSEDGTEKRHWDDDRCYRMG